MGLMPSTVFERSKPAALSRRKFVYQLIATTALAASAGSAFGLRAHAATAPDGAARFINWLADQAIKVLQTQGGNLSSREAALRDLLVQSFDLEFIGRFAVGRHWRTMNAEQRAEYIRLFSIYVLNTYASRFGGYSGEQFTVVNARAAGKKDAVVRSVIKRPSGPPIKADWRVRARGNQYRIIDISVEGISMAVTQRSEFSAVIKSNGVDGLVSALRARADKLPAITAN
jgi:phospholipid transport system substrate-binding protein